MAEHGAGSTGQDRGELRRVRQATWPNQKHAAVQALELAALNRTLDPPRRPPAVPQLGERHDSLLATRDGPDFRARRTETTHVVV